MKKISKQEVRKILGDNATSKQVEIVFALVDFQSETLTEKISKEIQKLKQKRDEAIAKIEKDFEEKSEKIFDTTLSKTVQQILKKNGIKISKAEKNSDENFSRVEENLNENETEIVSSSEEFSSKEFTNNFNKGVQNEYSY